MLGKPAPRCDQLVGVIEVLQTAVRAVRDGAREAASRVLAFFGVWLIYGYTFPTGGPQGVWPVRDRIKGKGGSK